MSLKLLSNNFRILEVFLILIALFSVYLIIALISFNPLDPSWSQTTWYEPIHNLGGSVGAWIADTLLFIFGIIAYSIPFMILNFCWIILRQYNCHGYIDYFALSLRIIGILLLVVTSSSIAALNADDIWYFSSGGVIGSLVSNMIISYSSSTSGTLLLLCIWAVGLTLYTGWSWLIIAEKIGALVIAILTFSINYLCSTLRNKEKMLIPIIENITQIEKKDNVQLVTSHDKINISTISSSHISSDYSASMQTKQEKKINIDIYPTIIKTVPLSAKLQPQINSTVQLEKNSDVLSYYQLDISQSNTNFSKDNIPTTTKIDKKWHNLTVSVADQKSVDISTINTKIKEIDLSCMSTSIMLEKINPQIKQGIGPEMPRPKPIKLPTRRELASYGIKLPSQRLAEEKKTRYQTQTIKQEKKLRNNDDIIKVQQKLYRNKQYVSTENQHEKTLLSNNMSNFIMNKSNIFDISQMKDTVNKKTDKLLINSVITNPISGYKTDSLQQQIFTNVPYCNNKYSKSNKISATKSVDKSVVSVGQKVSQNNLILTDQQSTLQNCFKPVIINDHLIHPVFIRQEQRLYKSTISLPTLDLLTSPPIKKEPEDMLSLERTARLVEECLANYRVKADVVGISPGPVITRFELDLAPGIKAARISNLSRDLARSLSAIAVRVVEVIPGKPYVGLELPNKHRQTVYLREVLDCSSFRDNPSPLSVVLGKDIAGQPVIADLAKMPHLLVAGTTGSGKSVGINAMIISMLYKATPEDVRFIMIDPKMLELSIYKGIPHLLTEVVTDMKNAANALRWCVGEMECRYKLMSTLGVRSLASYNEKIEIAKAMGSPILDHLCKNDGKIDTISPTLEKLPYIVVMVDEFADLIMVVGKKIEELIARLAQKARAAGIHLVLATQRPSVDVITGLIKANIPTRIAFTVSSKIDSRTILDQVGGESLLGMGDMLYMPPNSSIPIRVHGAFVHDQEVHSVVQAWKARGYPQYIENIILGDEGENNRLGIASYEALDPLFDQAVSFVIEKRRVSISGVQRHFRIGYNRAVRIIEHMEMHGIVSSPGNNGNRQVLVPHPYKI